MDETKVAHQNGTTNETPAPESGEVVNLARIKELVLRCFESGKAGPVDLERHITKAVAQDLEVLALAVETDEMDSCDVARALIVAYSRLWAAQELANALDCTGPVVS